MLEAVLVAGAVLCALQAIRVKRLLAASLSSRRHWEALMLGFSGLYIA